MRHVFKNVVLAVSETLKQKIAQCTAPIFFVSFIKETALMLLSPALPVYVQF